MTVKIYLSKHCAPCKEIEELIKDKGVEDDVELVYVDTDDGFQDFFDSVLKHTDGTIPSAYMNGQQCTLGKDEDGALAIDCPTDRPSSSDED